MMMVLFAWNAQRLNWLTTPPSLSPTPHLAPTVFVVVSFVVVVVVLTPFNVLTICLSYFLIFFTFFFISAGE